MQYFNSSSSLTRKAIEEIYWTLTLDHKIWLQSLLYLYLYQETHSSTINTIPRKWPQTPKKQTNRDRILEILEHSSDSWIIVCFEQYALTALHQKALGWISNTSFRSLSGKTMKYHTLLSFFFKFSTPSSKATSINHCLWPLQPHFTTPEGGKRPILFPQEIKKIKVNFLLNFPSKVSRRSNHLLTNPPTTFLLMLTRDLNKPLFDTPNVSSCTEFSGQSNLQKMFLIKSTKKMCPSQKMSQTASVIP